MKHARPRLLLTLALALLLPALSNQPLGCTCNGDPEGGAEAPRELPSAFPEVARETAPALARYLPGDAGAAFFVASYASFIEGLRAFRAWGLVDPQELDRLGEGLAIQYGLDPSSPGSWMDAGLDLTKGAAAAWLGQNVVLVFAVENEAAFRDRVDRFIDTRFGRPRPRSIEVGEHTVENLRVLTKDVISLAFVEGHCVIVTGQRFDDEARPSPELLAELLSLAPDASLAQAPLFQATLERLGAHGPFFGYSSNSASVRELLLSMAAGEPTLSRIVTENISGMTAAGFAVTADVSGLKLQSFAQLPEGRSDTTRAVVTPEAAVTSEALARYFNPDAPGVARFTFNPRKLEAQMMAMMGEQGAAQWSRLKGQGAIIGLEKNFLYNLTGQALGVLYDVDDAALSSAMTREQMLASMEFAVMLPFADAEAASSFFGGVGLAQRIFSDQIPPQAIFTQVEDRFAVQFKQRGEVWLQIVYDPSGVLVLAGGGKSAERAIARLEALASGEDVETLSPAKGTMMAHLLNPGPVWGLNVKMAIVERILASRFDIVKMQIATFLAPLDEIGMRAIFDEQGVGLNLDIEMAPPKAKP